MADQVATAIFKRLMMKLSISKFALLGTALLAGFASPAFADQKLVPAQSEITFVSKQMGVPVDGRFAHFDAQVSFDPAKPETSKVNFTVDIGSATVGAKESDAELVKAEWFNALKFPQATFASTHIAKTAPGKYLVNGRLTIKGAAQDISVPVTMTQTGASTAAVGAFVIHRLAFKIGENEWADTSMVADDVQVHFKLTLSGVGKL